MAVLSFPLLLLTQGLAEEQSDACVGDAGISYICGLMNAEDLLSVGDSGFILTSGMSGEG